jgi:hypothetical protein
MILRLFPDFRDRGADSADDAHIGRLRRAHYLALASARFGGGVAYRYASWQTYVTAGATTHAAPIFPRHYSTVASLRPAWCAARQTHRAAAAIALDISDIGLITLRQRHRLASAQAAARTECARELFFHCDA